jgi:hypothetical protein
LARACFLQSAQAVLEVFGGSFSANGSVVALLSVLRDSTYLDPQLLDFGFLLQHLCSTLLKFCRRDL